MSEKPFNKSIIQVTQNGKNTELDASTQIAIKNVLAQLTGLRDQIAALQVNQNIPRDQYGIETSYSGIRQAVAQFVNASGGNLYQGDVLRAGAVAGQATITTVKGDGNVLGAVFGDGTAKIVSATAFTFNSMVASSMADVAVCQRGKAKLRVQTDGTPIAIGDPLKSLDAARYACRAIPGEPGIFARALQSMAANLSGVIDADINPDLRFDNLLDNQDFAYKATYDTDGTQTGHSGFIWKETYYTDVTYSHKINAMQYVYSSDGFIKSSLMSIYATDGAGSHMLNQTFEYIDGLLDKVLQELA